MLSKISLDHEKYQYQEQEFWIIQTELSEQLSNVPLNILNKQKWFSFRWHKNIEL